MISGGLRLVIFGMNHNPLLTGQIAIIPLFIAAGTPPGILPVSVSNILALDPLGGSVSTGGVDGRVIVTAPPAQDFQSLHGQDANVGVQSS